MKHYFTLKEVPLNNNCPECYSNDGLELTFKQRFIENTFYKAITEETIHEMHCNTCNTDIFPVSWTNDIERVVTYQERAVQPKPTSTKLKKTTWILIIVSIITGIVIALLASGILKF